MLISDDTGAETGQNKADAQEEVGTWEAGTGEEESATAAGR